jgi:flagellar hook-length control protein FliK
MTPLAVLTAAPTAALSAGAGAAPTATCAPGEFARCMERAQAPARPDTCDEPAAPPTRDAAGAQRGSDDGAAAADTCTPNCDHEREGDRDDEAGAAAAPDLSLLLPGWPPTTAAAIPTPTATAATTPTADGCAVAAAAPLAAAAGVEDGVRTVAARDGALRAEPGHAVAAANDAVPALAAASAGNGRDVGDHDAAGGESAGADVPTTPQLQGAAEPRPPVAEPTAVPPLSSAPSATATTAHAKAAETAAAATALVAAAIDSPSFAPSLASQLRWWANEGVQQAQLQLNPAEMGPVAVRIVVDGREARIDFSADLPATRSALESALPVLAAALDEGGLKLTGGGVHDGAAQRQAAWQAPTVTQRTNGNGGPALDDAGAVRTAPRGAAARGLVDLVA